MDSETTERNNNNERAVEMEVPTEMGSDVIKDAQEEYGRYFGICCSNHHLKACICKYCPSYPGGFGMFCSKGKSPAKGKNEGCLCESCELFRKLGFEGKYFCRQD